jgi:CheY-like chemotaxis protein
VVGDRRNAERAETAGVLASLGYTVQPGRGAREVVAMAVASPDVELVLVDYSLASPAGGQLLQQLRRDARTARVPIGVVASSEDLRAAEALARQEPLVTALARTGEPVSMAQQVGEMLKRAGSVRMAAEERLGQAASALAALARLTESPAGLFNLLRAEAAAREALWVAELNHNATVVLSALGTAESQHVLVNLASQPLAPLVMRQAAAQAFARSVARYGTLLTTVEIATQYDRYNQSERLDRETQQVLSSILDVIEARAGVEVAAGTASDAS